jgi:hypothetical protein
VFLCNSIEGSPAVPASDPNIVFQSYGGGHPFDDSLGVVHGGYEYFNPSLDPEGNAFTGANLAHYTHIYVSRIYRLNTPGQFKHAWEDNANFLSTRQWTDPEFETSLIGGYPFYLQPDFSLPGYQPIPTFLCSQGIVCSGGGVGGSFDENETHHLN